ncbi:SIR2 family NAD-dependent protein deacylase [Corallococcus sp. 4LFB]|uniref:SIR2 family NAD-dependent protein deacylase n=1 Tax=Corallococcus sp. 4LFB TaxID=3383249 RepID=UPI003974C803
MTKPIGISINPDALLSTDDKAVLDGWIKSARRVRPVLFAGAGLSLNAIPRPGWRDRSPGRQDAPKCLSWHGLIEKLKQGLREGDRKENDYLRVAQYFKELQGLQQLHLQMQEAVPDHDLLPGLPHQVLSTIEWESILTTNYDTLIERAYESSGDRGQVHMVYRDQDLSRPRLPGAACELVHLHGILNDAASLVLTSEDYRRYVETHPGMVTRVRQLFTQHPVLVVGFSLDDPNFYALNGWVRDLLQSTGRPSVLCLQHEPISDARRSYWRGQGIQFISLKTPTDDFNFETLPEYYGTLLGGIAHLLGNTSDTMSRQWIESPSSLRKYIKNNIKEEPDATTALQALERVLIGLPRVPIDNRDQFSAWEAFAERWLIPNSGNEFSADRKLSRPTPSPLEGALRDASGGGTRTTTGDLSSRDSLSFVISSIKNDDVAMRWLFLGILYFGSKVSLSFQGEIYDLIATLREQGFEKKLSPQDRARVKLAECRSAYELENTTEAARIETEILSSHASETVRDELTRMRRLHAFRNARDPLRDEAKHDDDLSATSLSIQGAHFLLVNDVESAHRAYDAAVARARREHDRVSEWVAIQGLLCTLPFDEIGSYNPQQVETPSRRSQLYRRLDKLREDRDVKYLEERVSRTKNKARTQLLDGVENELRDLKRFPEGGSSRFNDYSHLWNALLKLEELGLPPNYCMDMAKLVGEFAFRQTGGEFEAVSLLVRYGATESLERLFELYPPSDYASQEDFRKILNRLLSPGRVPREWVAQMGAIKHLMPSLSQEDLGALRSFLEQFAGVLSLQHSRSPGRNNVFAGRAVWAVWIDLVDLAFYIASHFEDSTGWLLRFLDSDDLRVRTAAVERLHRVAWSDLNKLGRLDVDEVVRAVMRVLRRDVDSKQKIDISYTRGLFGGISSLLATIEPEKSPSYQALAEAVEKTVLKWMSNTSNENRFSEHEAMRCLKHSATESSLNVVRQSVLRAHARLVDHSASENDVGFIVEMFDFLNTEQIHAALVSAEARLARDRVSIDLVSVLSLLPARVLTGSRRRHWAQAARTTEELLRRHPAATRSIALIPASRLSGTTSLLQEKITDLLRGNWPLEPGAKRPAPWNQFNRQHNSSESAWYLALVAGLQAARRFSLVNTVIPTAWIPCVELAARHPSRNVAAEALAYIGKTLSTLHPKNLRLRWLHILGDGLGRTESSVCATSAFWLGVLSSPAHASATAVEAQSILDAGRNDAKAEIKYYADIGRASAELEARRDIKWWS